MKTTLLTETHPLENGATRIRALLRVEGDVPADRRRVPLNLALVLDRSGSMGGGKLQAVQEASRGLIQRLHPDDVVSVVAFDDQVVTAANPGTAGDQTGLLDALMAIRPGGATNLSGGWLQGRALLQERFEAEGVNRVILLTDGLANQGITDAETLTRLTAQAHRDGVGTTTVGVGEHFDEELLAAMADAGGGSSYYIERPDQAGGIFEEEVEGLLSIAAQNLTVSVRPRTGASVATVHHQYPSQVGADDALILSVGDLYAREPREVLADFLVPGGAPASTESGGEEMAEGAAVDSPVADFVIEADCWTGDETMERRRISIPITWSPDAGAVTHPEVARVFTLLEAARARREAVERGDRGDLAGAVQTLRDAAGHLAAHHPSDPLMVAEAQDLHRAAQAMEDEAEFRAMDRKYLRTQASHYARSRRSAGQRTTRG